MRQPLAFSHPFAKYTMSAVESNSKDFPKNHKGLASAGALWKNESITSISSSSTKFLFALAIAFSLSFKTVSYTHLTLPTTERV